ncbi:Gfo/Idh/MocA family protein [Alteribacillus sp. HJP-4]|uniref:Gfo/Idh/MocA family protein n=1 Tax=Alteribacillus sp. HJP-4 TaxID=2775394 RepID=UPI0035CCF5A2
MKRSLAIVLVGIGGYGNDYLREMRENDLLDYIEGVVDIYPEKSDYYEEIKSRNIPVYASLEAFYESHSADLAVISTPIHFHTAQTICALENNSNVLCEKPMSPSVEEAEQIIALKSEKSKFVAIGFNWSFSSSIQELKKDILNGAFGKAKRLKTLALWPRNDDYYARSPWAGKKYSSAGSLIFDSVANNATSHFLHNMFYILGDKQYKSTDITEITAELYRANPIETFDTCALKGTTENGADFYFFAAHAVAEQLGPVFEYEFEKAVITYNRYEPMKAVMADGTVKTYSDPEKERSIKIHRCIEMIEKNESEPMCGPEAALTHVKCINGLHESVPEAIDFPEAVIHYNKEEKRREVEGLEAVLKQCYEKWRLPSDIEAAVWAQRGGLITNQ